MKKKYNFTQVTFCLNYLSNIAGLKKGTAAELQTWMDKEVKLMMKDQEVIDLLGEWKVDWGPVVYSGGVDVKKQVASNTMLVFKNKEEDCYIISVAGTNGPSRYGWFTEDFKVYETVAWLVDNPDVRISMGTSIGLNILKKEMVSGGKTIQEYLQNVFTNVKKPTQVIVTGHSLGGALSAGLALSLADEQKKWDPNHYAVVSAMPTAGASPGNLAFSEYYGNMLGTRTYRVWNYLDAVPNGWQHNTLTHIPWIYYPYFSPGVIVQALATTMSAAATRGANALKPGGGYTQLLPETGPVQGAVNLSMIHNLDVNAQQKIIGVLLKLLVQPKVKAWLTKIGISDLVQHAILAIIKLASETKWGGRKLEEMLKWVEKELAAIKNFENEKLRTFVQFLHFVSGETLNLLVFVEQVLYQHTTAYTELFSIEKFAEIYKAYSATYKGNESPDTTIEDLIEIYGEQLLTTFTAE